MKYLDNPNLVSPETYQVLCARCRRPTGDNLTATEALEYHLYVHRSGDYPLCLDCENLTRAAHMVDWRALLETVAPESWLAKL